MYASLHRVDLVGDTDEGTLGVQTDHRDAEEIEAQRSISVVFAITRLLAPRVAKAPGGPAHYQYACMGEAPPFLRELVAACGARLSENGARGVGPFPPIDAPAVSQAAHDALMALGEAVLARESLEPTAEGLADLERQLGRAGLDVEEDETRYYEALVELGAAAGVMLARLAPAARWHLSEQLNSVIPLEIRADGLIVNVFGRAERFLDGEVAQGPSVMTGMMRDREEDDGPLVGVLKPAGWSPGAPMLSHPLLEGEEAGASLPLIVYGNDHPSSVAYLKADTAGMTVDEARAQAQAFYRGIQVELERVGEDPAIWTVSGDYFAPEKLLDQEFARGLHERLKSKMLLVGLPKRWLALVVAAEDDPRRATLVLKSVLEQAVADASPADRISAVPFVMVDGRIVGFASFSTGDAPTSSPAPAPAPAPAPKKKSFWKRLFGG